MGPLAGASGRGKSSFAWRASNYLVRVCMTRRRHLDLWGYCGSQVLPVQPARGTRCLQGVVVNTRTRGQADVQSQARPHKIDLDSSLWWTQDSNQITCEAIVSQETCVLRSSCLKPQAAGYSAPLAVFLNARGWLNTIAAKAGEMSVGNEM